MTRIEQFEAYLIDFQDLPDLRRRILYVLEALPDEVQLDFVSDHRFTVAKDNFEHGKGSSVFMAAPGPDSQKSRSVILRPRLNECSADFAHYVIAHEFAHAFLHNGPWGDITDVEAAADALAAHWGFHRPSNTPWSSRQV